MGEGRPASAATNKCRPAPPPPPSRPPSAAPVSARAADAGGDHGASCTSTCPAKRAVLLPSPMPPALPPPPAARCAAARNDDADADADADDDDDGAGAVAMVRRGVSVAAPACRNLAPHAQQYTASGACDRGGHRAQPARSVSRSVPPSWAPLCVVDTRADVRRRACRLRSPRVRPGWGAASAYRWVEAE